MNRKRDGPASRTTTPGPRQQGEVGARLLPQRKSSRNPPGRSPSKHPRVRRRQPSGWREFNVRVFTKPDAEGVHRLHVFLRNVARKFGLEIAEIDEVTKLHDPE